MSTELLTELDEAIESSQAQEEPSNDELDDAIAGDDDDEAKSKEDGEKDDSDESGKEKKEGEDEVDDPDKKKNQPKKEKPSRLVSRIDELTREKYELRRELERYKKSEIEKEPELPPKPDPRDYKFDPEKPETKIEAQRLLDRDTGKWEAEVERIKGELERKKEDAKKAEEDRVASETFTRNNRIAEDSKRYKDYDPNLSKIAHLKMTEELHDALLEIPNPAGVMRFFNRNPIIAEKVLSLPSLKQSRQIALISYKLDAAEKKSPNVSGAPNPGKKLPSGGSGGGKDPSKMSAEEYSIYKAKLREKERNKK